MDTRDASPSAQRKIDFDHRRASLMGLGGSKEDLVSAVELYAYSVKSGWLYKRGGGNISRAWKKRWFILSGGILFYYKSDKERKQQGKIVLRGYMVEGDFDDLKEKRYQFVLRPKDTAQRVFYIYAATGQEKKDWMEVLKNSTQGEKITKQSVEIEEKLRRNAYEIGPFDLEWSPGNILGKGASGVVKKGIWLKTTEVAVKGLNNLPEFTDVEEMQGFYQEIETLSQLRHPNIVTMFGYCKKDGYLCLVTEFVRGGDLSSHIHDLGREIDLHLQLDLMISICRGMIYLHNIKIIHRDLKPQNILVETLHDSRVKVCDFGLSGITKAKEDLSMSSRNVLESSGGYQTDGFIPYYGSPGYAAPELPTPRHNSKVDVFSFGIMMWEIVTREQPWANAPTNTSAELADYILAGNRLPIPQTCSQDLGDLIISCWASDPHLRPSFAMIYEKIESLRAELPPPNSTEFEIDRKGRNTIENSFLSHDRYLDQEDDVPNISRRSYDDMHLPDIRQLQFTSVPAANPAVASVPAAYRGSIYPNVYPAVPENSGFSHDPDKFLANITRPASSMYSLPVSANQTMEQKLLKGFGDATFMYWDDFVNHFVDTIPSAHADQIEGMRYVLTAPPSHPPKVQKTVFATFLEWFSPLAESDTYNSQSTSVGGFEISQIADIVEKQYFFGFMTAAEARVVLQTQQTGSFLIRFSSNAGAYALSVNYGQIVHWRITTEREDGFPIIFKVCMSMR
eukprot:TRINITY_DN92_c0_g2_i1.p1 TRINITY_DN92_c0_g2~~TRINITY_DN92_c0_g2_i1.p1  ORF type:complete len:736 (+),score=176.03 TRINITY_DN92_c0_g2_i1:89-2296(+)